MSVKQDTLSILEENRGSHISGHKIAEELGVSRAMVWKAIKALQAEGYRITASTRKGYCFEAENDLLSEASIRPFVQTEHVGKIIKVFKTLDSTNNTAKQLASQGIEHGTVIIAEEQTKGRGRMGRQFFSPSELGVYMSIVLRPELFNEQTLLVTCGAAVAVAKAIEKVAHVETQIKWVNDIYLEGKKVCGILTEASMNLENGQFEYIILGIGVNVKTKTEDFPESIQNIADSIARKSTFKHISRSYLIGEIINNIEEIYNYLDQKSFLTEYKNRSYIIGEDIIYTMGNIRAQATAIDIDDKGGLVIKDESGEIKVLNSGEISVRKAADVIR